MSWYDLSFPLPPLDAQMRIKFNKDFIAPIISVLALGVSLWSLEVSRDAGAENRQLTFALKKFDGSNLLTQLDVAFLNILNELHHIANEAISLGDTKLNSGLQEYADQIEKARSKNLALRERLRSMPDDQISQKNLLTLVDIITEMMSKEEMDAMTKRFLDIANEKLKIDREAATKQR
jgi:hypothetical protein